MGFQPGIFQKFLAKFELKNKWVPSIFVSGSKWQRVFLYVEMNIEYLVVENYLQLNEKLTLK